jgi:FKBP-type peptidyl-prolyl cis-trans isomerase FklB
MQNTFTMALLLWAAAWTLPGKAAAQQTPAPNSSQSPAAKTSQASPAKTSPSSVASTSNNLALQTDKAKRSYALGLSMGKSMQRDGVDIDPNVLLRGLKDALSNAKPLLTDDETQAVMLALQTEVQKTRQDQQKAKEEKMQQAAEKNKTEGEAFLAANKTKEGVVTLPSGLQYKILKQGTGPKPTAADSVVCNYRGTLIDGTEFDSSYKRGQPATFPVAQVIPAWTEALQLMPVGSKWQLFIPSELGYGARGAGADIGPNATLVFDVELLSIKGQ